MIKTKLDKVILICLFLLVILPWFISDYSDDIVPEIVTSDLSFYEVNTCKVSLAEFLVKNPNTIYQDHYRFTLNHYSSISCFGKIAGLTQVGQDFSIAIGTNTLISLFMQSLFFLLCVKMIKPQKQKLIINNTHHRLSLLASTLLLCLLIFSEVRYYEKNLYLLDLASLNSYILLFAVFYLINDNFMSLLNNRFNKLINYIPLMFVFVGSFTGLNANVYMSVFFYYGFYSLLSKEVKYKYLYVSITLIFFWSINAIGDNFGFKPDKLRGFTSSFFSYRTVAIWGILFFGIVLGLYFIFKNTVKYFNLELLRRNLMYSTILLLVLGYLGSTNPFIRFVNYFFFGQEKMGTTEANLFKFDEWSEKVAWRGFFSSAETAGEFYGIVIIFLIFPIIKNQKKDFLSVLLLIFPVVGLYLSNNRTVFILLISGLAFYLLKIVNLKIQYKIVFLLGVLISTVLFIGVDKFTYEYSYQSIYIQANSNSIDYENSTYLNLLNSRYGIERIYTFLFSTFTFLGYILNRSELWGLFFARYNPNYFEYLFGSGPLNLGQLYSEIDVKETESLLFPHSSLLSLFVYIGVFGVFLILYKLFSKIIKMRKTLKFEDIFITLYLTINLIKSDSLNFIHAFTLYYFLIFLIFNLNKPIFEIYNNKQKTQINQ